MPAGVKPLRRRFSFCRRRDVLRRRRPANMLRFPTPVTTEVGQDFVPKRLHPAAADLGRNDVDPIGIASALEAPLPPPLVAIAREQAPQPRIVSYAGPPAAVPWTVPRVHHRSPCDVPSSSGHRVPDCVPPLIDLDQRAGKNRPSRPSGRAPLGRRAWRLGRRRRRRIRHGPATAEDGGRHRRDRGAEGAIAGHRRSATASDATLKRRRGLPMYGGS